MATRTGDDDDNYLTGTKFQDVLIGNGGDDVLDGGLRADRMLGGDGNDSYYVDNRLDQVVEGENHGDDTVYSSISYALSDNVENLELAKHYDPANPDKDLNGMGNLLDNYISGNDGSNVLQGMRGNDGLSGYAGKDTLIGGAGNDWLDGGAGADRMSGGDGDDGYYVDDAGDVVTENAYQGRDYVDSSIDYILGDNVEDLGLETHWDDVTPDAALNGTGNVLNNNIWGNNAPNVLDGREGNDGLYGYAGDDTLLGGAGNDYLDGSDGNDALSGQAGNDGLSGGLGDDSLDGGTGNDWIYGDDGQDALIGGEGRDSLEGGAGNDSFRFDSALGASNVDTIVDFTTGTDVIALDDGIFTAFSGAGTVGADNFIAGDGVTAAADADDFLIQDTSTGALYYDADGNGAGFEAVQFAQVNVLLSASDFAVV